MNWQFWLRNRSGQNDCPDACADVRPLLSLMSDGMASSRERRQIESHLAGCALCRQTQTWMEATHLAIAERPAALPPADMRARIAQAIAASADTALPVVPTVLSPVRRPLVLRPAFAAAMSLAIGGAILGHALLNSHTTPNIPNTPPSVALVPPKAPAIPSVTPSRRPELAARPPVHTPYPLPRPIVAELPKTNGLGAQTHFAPAKHELSLPRPFALSKPNLIAFVPKSAGAKSVTPRIPSPTSVKAHDLTHIAKLPAPATHLPAAPAPVESQAHMASNPPAAPAPDTTPVSAPPTETHTPPVFVASNDIHVSASARPADALSDIRPMLTGRQGNYGRHLSMDPSAQVQSANFVMQPLIYTPTKDSDSTPKE